MEYRYIEVAHTANHPQHRRALWRFGHCVHLNLSGQEKENIKKDSVAGAGKAIITPSNIIICTLWHHVLAPRTLAHNMYRFATGPLASGQFTHSQMSVSPFTGRNREQHAAN